MSRVGKKPIPVPKGVAVAIETAMVRVTGPKGSVTALVPKGITVSVNGGQIEVARLSEEKRERAFHGLTRALVQNAVIGVTEGYKKEVDLVGIGYKAEKKGNVVIFSCGFSHTVPFPEPEGVQVNVAPDAKAKDVTHIIVTGVDKQKVGQTANVIRGIRPPDPYKLKGFRFVGEVLKKKAGKATGK
jgi:large subunit ribosomal protein L6